MRMPCLDFFGGDGIRYGFGSLHDVPCEGFRETISPHDREDVDARIIDMAKNLSDFALRLMMSLRILRDMHDDLVPCHRMHVLSFRDIDILEELLIIRLHEAVCFIFTVEADNVYICVLKDLCDMSFSAFAIYHIILCDDDSDLVAIHGISCVVRRDEDVIFTAINRHEAEAPRVCLINTDMREVLFFSVLSAFRDANLTI